MICIAGMFWYLPVSHMLQSAKTPASYRKNAGLKSRDVNVILDEEAQSPSNVSQLVEEHKAKIAAMEANYVKQLQEQKEGFVQQLAEMKRVWQSHTRAIYFATPLSRCNWLSL